MSTAAATDWNQVTDDAGTARQLYLELLKTCLTRTTFRNGLEPLVARTPRRKRLLGPIQQVLHAADLVLARPVARYRTFRADGGDWPADAETMIGLKRLDNLQFCAEQVLRNAVPGDFIETGVWRGGAAILMRAVIKAYGDRTRKVWAADSFRGLPKPNAAEFPADAGDRHWTVDDLAVPLDEVKANFEQYGLLDDQVEFLVGWFKETLHLAPIERLALARLDGDMYESTFEAMRVLYPKLSVGGFLIVDDYAAIPGCRRAIDDYRSAHGINEPLQAIDWTGVFWQRQS